MGVFKVSRLQRVLDWLPAALSVLMITLESTATMSAENTSEWLYPLWVKLFGAISPGPVAPGVHPGRALHLADRQPR
jgi:hypothetical protein